MTLFNCPLKAQVKVQPDSPALIFEDKIRSYKDFDAAVERTQVFLNEKKILACQRVAILADNHFNYVVVLYALWRCKAVAVPINTRLPDDIIQKQIKNLECVFVFQDRNIAFDLPSYNILALPTQADVKQFPESSMDFRQEATVLFTSGSSADPKAASHTFGNHYHNALGSNKFIPFGPGDRWLLNLPLFHVGGLAIIFRTFIGGGCCVIASSQNEILNLIGRYKITHLSLVPTQLQRLIDAGQISELQSCQSILVGGAPVWQSLKNSIIENKLPVRLTYGLTEMSSQVATTEVISKEKISEAKILKYRQLKIKNDGEICVKGETLFKGYYKSIKGDSHQKVTVTNSVYKKTSSVLELQNPCDSDGWFATGDLGDLTDEGLTVRGRKDNLFISGGENIQPEEIEAVLLNIDGIAAAVVVPIHDSEFGQRPVAFVRLETGDNRVETLDFRQKNKHGQPATSNQQLRIPDHFIIEQLKQKLPKYKIPIKFYPWPEEQEGLKVSREFFRNRAVSF